MEYLAVRCVMRIPFCIYTIHLLENMIVCSPLLVERR